VELAFKQMQGSTQAFARDAPAKRIELGRESVHFVADRLAIDGLHEFGQLH
jgi:hypothetical protein